LSESFEATIWQAARATSAAPTFFAPVVIDDVRYADGGTGYNNPADLALDEARNIWGDRPLGCLVSLGTGLEDSIRLGDGTEGGKGWKRTFIGKIAPKTNFDIEVAEFCVDLLTSSETVHRKLKKRAESLGIVGSYFRFNVPQGMSQIRLDEWTKVEDIIASARDYMDNDEVEAKTNVAKILLDKIPSTSSIVN
jgi:predicted acylesterase/phospholipase RssA